MANYNYGIFTRWLKDNGFPWIGSITLKGKFINAIGRVGDTLINHLFYLRAQFFPASCADTFLYLHGAARGLHRISGESISQYRIRILTAYPTLWYSGTRQGMENALELYGWRVPPKPYIFIQEEYNDTTPYFRFNGTSRFDGSKRFGYPFWGFYFWFQISDLSELPTDDELNELRFIARKYKPAWTELTKILVYVTNSSQLSFDGTCQFDGTKNFGLSFTTVEYPGE